MAEYDSAIALAKRLIEKKGRAGVRLLSSGKGAPSNPVRPWRPDAGSSADAVLAQGLRVAFFDAIRARNGALIVAESTAAAYLAMASLPAGVVPADGMLLETGSRRYFVLKVEELAPGDQVVMYILHLKG